MRVLLVSNASYDPPRGGSTRSNLEWLRHLAASGHEVRVMAPALGEADCERVVDGMVIESLKGLSFRAGEVRRRIVETQPDWVLVSSEDVSHVLLREAGAAAAGRLVYLAHTPQFFPFGPESWHGDDAATELVRRAAEVVVIGRHMEGYVERHLGRKARVIHPPMYGRPPYREMGRFGSGFVLMINPCAVKGLAIFLGLAERFPDVEFAALNGWGTTREDRAALRKLPNTRLLENVPSIEEVLEGARLLLMPSVWYEGFGLIAMEAMLRGLPVMASDSGGLEEAKRGTGYVVAVRPVERYEAAFDETLMPRAVVPEQDLTEWEAGLRRLLNDEEEYWREARTARARALEFVAGLDAGEFERMLMELKPAGVVAEKPALDAARRALLMARLKRKAQG